MAFRLNVDGTEVELPQGEFVVGRNEDCHLRLDDALVSRHHAKFVQISGRLSVEDLGSRNGITVNGVGVPGRIEVRAGDIVGLGGAKLIVMGDPSPKAAPGRPKPRPERETMTFSPSSAGSARTELASRTKLVENALAERNYAAAEYQIDTLADGLMLDGPAIRANPSPLREFTRLAMLITQATNKASNLDRIFVLHKMLACKLTAAEIDELHAVARKVRYGNAPALRSYLEWLREKSADLTPPERFALQRLEGLARVLAVGG